MSFKPGLIEMQLHKLSLIYCLSRRQIRQPHDVCSAKRGEDVLLITCVQKSKLARWTTFVCFFLLFLTPSSFGLIQGPVYTRAVLVWHFGTMNLQHTNIFLILLSV